MLHWCTVREQPFQSMRLTAEGIENLTTLSGVAYEKFWAIFVLYDNLAQY
jgi:hypothetical protein